ncbi:MAG TPA: thiamine pyrophosphate-binding protein, partial [Candidatus Hydrogenedentes bacterium]|nr:thiamine pyrophosphate-binding protein [Candidatus Hydrogenedentota bacterium]
LHRVTRRIEMDVAVFARWLAASAPGAADAAWCDALRRANRAAAAAIAAWERDRDELDEIAVARLVPELLPEGAAIFCGNSMPIRDLDMYAPGDGAAVRVFANRGASGIDGNIATAAGVARALQGPMAAVIGDLAALHDLNSLALLRGMDTPFILVIVNNDGGGIFSFLPVAEYPDHFERFFAAPHGLCFRDAAGLFGLGYCNPRTKADFEVAFRSALEAGGAVIIEVNTKRDENLVVHRALQAEIAAVTDGACMTNA